jgi:SAM-dependent methyltransferase
VSINIEQHNLEILQNKEFWEKKPLLRKVYAHFYREIAREVNSTLPGFVVELGSGIGCIKQFIPEAITSDIFPNPWLDRVESAYQLSFDPGQVSHLILFDVWHHLRYPGTALKEFSRVLVPGGRIIIFEPAMGLIGRTVLGLFHHEPLGLNLEIEWTAPSNFQGQEADYYAAQGNASRIFGTAEFASELDPWRITIRKYYSGLAYVASGGFRGPQLYPERLLALFEKVDEVLSRFPRLASRMLVVLEQKNFTESF